MAFRLILLLPGASLASRFINTTNPTNLYRTMRSQALEREGGGFAGSLPRGTGRHTVDVLSRAPCSFDRRLLFGFGSRYYLKHAICLVRPDVIRAICNHPPALCVLCFGGVHVLQIQRSVLRLDRVGVSNDSLRAWDTQLSLRTFVVPGLIPDTRFVLRSYAWVPQN